MDNALGILAMVAVPGYWGLQYFMAKQYDGGWRIAALVPLVVMVPLLAYTAFAFVAGSNLWPLMLILASPLAFVYLVIVMAIRAMT
jgi:hypothetical protein